MDHPVNDIYTVLSSGPIRAHMGSVLLQDEIKVPAMRHRI